MFLKQLEIQGFKSFAKKTVLEFDPGIISVVGPNGSGKSNFSDAIRWVLGEQSMKIIRSKKGEDVIFAGSDKKSKLGMAEVAIAFDNQDRRLPLDFSEVVITRRLFRDGESEYLINGQQVRLMDITDMLARSGYGNNSYHVISQGTIDQLIISGPASMKSLIEEASGVKPYFNKRERALHKLERSQQNLVRVADLIAEIEPRLKSLRRQAKRMEQRETLAAELRGLERVYFASRYQDLSNILAEHDRETGVYNARLEVLSQEAENLALKVKQLEVGSGKKSEEYAGLMQKLRLEESQKNKVQEELAMMRGRIRSGAPQGSEDLQVLMLRKSDLERSLAQMQSASSDLQHRILLGEKNLGHHQKIAARMQTDIDGVNKSIENAQYPFDWTKLKEDIERIYSRYQSLLYTIKNLNDEADFKILQEDAGNLEIILVRLKDRLMKLVSSQLGQAELLHLNGKLQQVFSQKDQLSSELVKIRVEMETARSELAFHETRIAEATSELQKIKAQLKKSPSSANPLSELAGEEAALQKQLQKYFDEIKHIEAALKSFIDSESSDKKLLLETERQLRSKQDEVSKVKDKRGLILIERARSEANLESLLAQMRKSQGTEFAEEVKTLPLHQDVAGLEHRITKLRAQLEMVGGVDDLAMQEYRETEERYTHLTTQSNDLQSAVDDLRKVITELDLVIKKQFESGYEKINGHFSDYFRLLFGGGRASMSLIRQRILQEGASQAEENEETYDDEENGGEKEEKYAMGAGGSKEEIVGIDIKATPPGKKLALLSALSGGERTMTAIALLMAILTAFPSPFVVLDEVDAALDEANSIRFGKILSRLSHQTQFITITHNRETMRNAGVLYGITMGDDGVSKVLSIKLEKAVEIAQ